MARFRRMSRGRRTNWVSRQEHLWTVSKTSDFAVAAATVFETDIVSPSDWTSRAGFERATLVRVRGWILAYAAGTVNDTVDLAIYHRDDRLAAVDPSLAATYTGNDILWTSGGLAAKVATGDHSQVVFREVDIRVKRKLVENSSITLVGHSTAAVTYSICLRGLVVPK